VTLNVCVEAHSFIEVHSKSKLKTVTSLLGSLLRLYTLCWLFYWRVGNFVWFFVCV